MGFIRQQRDQVFSSSGQQKELNALQQQLQDAMSQMQHIRYDIRSSARMMPFQCGPDMLSFETIPIACRIRLSAADVSFKRSC